MNVILRQATVGDYGWIIAQHGLLYVREFSVNGGFEFNIADKVVRLFRESQPGHRVWIAEADGEKAGSIAISERSGKTGFVNFVLVLPKFRGQQLGSRLMDEMMSYATAYGYNRLRLETYTVLVDARLLYQKLGFKLAESKPQRRFGVDLTQELWELELDGSNSRPL